jgi:NAD(P)H dehydrogenase (quinone)
MRILILLAHPKIGSFNHAIADTVIQHLEKNGHEPLFHDLYSEEFDPLLQADELEGDFSPRGLLKEHCDDLISADGIVIIHPNWRDQPPAILKGWIDRVLRTGVAFEFVGENGEAGIYKPLLTASNAIVFNTSDCSEAVESELGDPLESFWKDRVFKSCGVKNVFRRNLCEVFISTGETRKLWLNEVARELNTYFIPTHGIS